MESFKLPTIQKKKYEHSISGVCLLPGLCDFITPILKTDYLNEIDKQHCHEDEVYEKMKIHDFVTKHYSKNKKQTHDTFVKLTTIFNGIDTKDYSVTFREKTYVFFDVDLNTTISFSGVSIFSMYNESKLMMCIIPAATDDSKFKYLVLKKLPQTKTVEQAVTSQNINEYFCWANLFNSFTFENTKKNKTIWDLVQRRMDIYFKKQSQDNSKIIMSLISVYLDLYNTSNISASDVKQIIVNLITDRTIKYGSFDELTEEMAYKLFLENEEKKCYVDEEKRQVLIVLEKAAIAIQIGKQTMEEGIEWLNENTKRQTIGDLILSSSIFENIENAVEEIYDEKNIDEINTLINNDDTFENNQKSKLIEKKTKTSTDVLENFAKVEWPEVLEVILTEQKNITEHDVKCFMINNTVDTTNIIFNLIDLYLDVSFYESVISSECINVTDSNLTVEEKEQMCIDLPKLISDTISVDFAQDIVSFITKHISFIEIANSNKFKKFSDSENIRILIAKQIFVDSMKFLIINVTSKLTKKAFKDIEISNDEFKQSLISSIYEVLSKKINAEIDAKKVTKMIYNKNNHDKKMTKFVQK